MLSTWTENYKDLLYPATLIPSDTEVHLKAKALSLHPNSI